MQCGSGATVKSPDHRTDHIEILVGLHLLLLAHASDGSFRHMELETSTSQAKLVNCSMRHERI